MKHLQGVALCMHGAGVGILHALRLGPELSQLAVSHVLAPFGVNFWSIQPCKCLYVTRSSLQCCRGTRVQSVILPEHHWECWVVLL